VDELLVQRSVVEDTKAARALILAGRVFIKSDQRVVSGALKVHSDMPFRVKSKRDHPWVSRGGLKLRHALDAWPALDSVVERGVMAIDVGSSTGGFTDVLLSAGARAVFSVDVGKGILDWRLRSDPRVIILEGFNARELSRAALVGAAAAAGAEADGEIGLVVCDASFIRLAAVLPAALGLCSDGAMVCALIKPQFEASREDCPGGVVRSALIHTAVCQEACEWLIGLEHWQFEGLERSPVLGPSGNAEFLLFGSKHQTGGRNRDIQEKAIRAALKKATGI